MSNIDNISPLTKLTEDEQFFYDTVKDFAKEKVQPFMIKASAWVVAIA